jgi:hypothetical protein
MGWLFAVALGLQEGRAAAVLRALPPIALGHAASVAVVVALVALAQLVVPLTALRLAGAAALLLFGAWRLARRGAHPRWVGMRVGFRDLTLWSFLMSSAHGAGLMLVPILLGAAAPRPPVAGAVTPHALHGAPPALPAPPSPAGAAGAGLLAVTVHTAAMLAVMAAVAFAVYYVLGLGLLRRAWINVDLLWAAALIIAGVVTLL